MQQRHRLSRRAELRWLGIAHSPSFVGEPQCNGVIERFMRTLKEQCLWLHRFTDLAHAVREIGAFIERYTTEWLVEHHDHWHATGDPRQAVRWVCSLSTPSIRCLLLV